MSDFYRERDRLNGGTDNQYTRAADFSLGAIDQDGDSEDTVDMRADDDSRTSGVLSQSDLASGGSGVTNSVG